MTKPTLTEMTNQPRWIVHTVMSQEFAICNELKAPF